MQENGGCQGNHNFFITVLDGAGNPLNGVTVLIFWDGANPGIYAISGSKGSGKIDQPVQPGDYYLRVVQDSSAGRPVKGDQKSRLMRTGFWPQGEWQELKDAGYPIDNPSFYCYGHYSWDVEIRRTW
jgi:hypothetical protein